jgi:hypothetical protein
MTKKIGRLVLSRETVRRLAVTPRVAQAWSGVTECYCESYVVACIEPEPGPTTTA